MKGLVKWIFAGCDAAARSYRNVILSLYVLTHLTYYWLLFVLHVMPQDITGRIDLPAYDLPALSVRPFLSGIES